MFFDRPYPAMPPRMRLYHSVPTPASYQRVCSPGRSRTRSWSFQTLVGAFVPSSSCPGLFQVPSKHTTMRLAMGGSVDVVTTCRCLANSLPARLLPASGEERLAETRPALAGDAWSAGVPPARASGTREGHG